MATVSEELARFATRITIDDLNDAVIDKTVDLVIDTAGCSIGAYTSPPAKALRRAYLGNRGSNESTVVGTELKTGVESAALINATMARYLDYNDCYMANSAACHPSDHIMALISVAEAEGAMGSELIEAIVTAYEVEARGLDHSPVRVNGFDYAAWGAYSSVASVGRLMDLSTDELSNALGIVGASNNPLYITRRGEVSMWKGVAHPYITHNAIQACQMAKHGLTGPREIFEGQFGFFDVVSSGETSFEEPPEPGDLRIMETSIKSFACGYYIHSPVTGVLDLIDEHAIETDDIDAIHIEMFKYAVDALATPEKWNKDLNRETADHSIPYTVAVAVVDGEVTPEQYSEDRLRDASVHELMDKITVREDPALTDHRKTHPRHIPSSTTITAGGKEYHKRIDCPLGHPERPMTRDQIEAKMADNSRGLLTDEQIQDFLSTCRSLEELPRVDQIVDSLVI